MTSESTGPEQGSRWRKGQSGNPKGRPRGARNKATVAAEALLDGQAKALTQACIDRALAGDSVALRLCLERILPPRKDRPVRMSLSHVRTPADVLLVLTAILEAVCSGELTPDEGDRLAYVVEQARKALETVELEQRIATLEQRVPNKAKWEGR